MHTHTRLSHPKGIHNHLTNRKKWERLSKKKKTARHTKGAQSAQLSLVSDAAPGAGFSIHFELFELCSLFIYQCSLRIHLRPWGKDGEKKLIRVGSPICLTTYMMFIKAASSQGVLRRTSAGSDELRAWLLGREMCLKTLSGTLGIVWQTAQALKTAAVKRNPFMQLLAVVLVRSVTQCCVSNKQP